MKQDSTGLIKETLTTWQPYYVEPLTEEDAAAIVTNMTEFLQLLAGWEDREPATARPSPGRHADANP